MSCSPSKAHQHELMLNALAVTGVWTCRPSRGTDASCTLRRRCFSRPRIPCMSSRWPSVRGWFERILEMPGLPLRSRCGAEMQVVGGQRCASLASTLHIWKCHRICSTKGLVSCCVHMFGASYNKASLLWRSNLSGHDATCQPPCADHSHRQHVQHHPSMPVS